MRSDVVFHVFVALLVIVVVSKLTGILFRLMGQPAVIGEIAGGIVLGPSLFGQCAPQAFAFVFPPELGPFLQLLAQIGVSLYMVRVGWELDMKLLRMYSRATMTISMASIAVPFGLGSALSKWLYPRFSNGKVSPHHFMLFISVAMSITAFPVLTRLLSDLGLTRTRIGAIAITCAAIDDVVGWCFVGLIAGLSGVRPESGWHTVASVAGYLLLMFFVIRPLLHKVESYPETSMAMTWRVSVAWILLLASLVVSEAIGIHSIFGAFLFGTILRKQGRIATEMVHSMASFVLLIALPTYFAFTGIRTQINLLDRQGWFACSLIVLIASLGKFGGGLVGAWGSGLSWRDASSIGVLINTRGLMELIILNIGFDLHIISQSLFAIFVLMALLTTVATTPALRILQGRRVSTALRPELSLFPGADRERLPRGASL